MYNFSNEQANMTSSVIELAHRHAAKHWRTVWSHLTSRNAPWDQAGRVPHYKRDSSATAAFCPFRHKLNRHFDQHTLAAELRDTGQSGRLASKPAAKWHPLELEDFGDQSSFSSTPCQVIKVTGVKGTTFGIHNSVMKIGNTIYSVNDIDYIFWRRAKFRPTGIEIFFRTGKSVLLDFLNLKSRSMVNSIYKKMTPKVAIVQRAPSCDFVQQLGVVQDWLSGKLSNFDYLMWLNMLGGRSFHDPCQYPIFPWVLSDYKSETLDLANPRVFRDLSKPIVAINKERLDDLLNRMEDLKQCGFGPHLCSSYCSFPLAIFLYLIRMEPFTSLHIALQGGRFDTPQRIFQSLSDCYYLVTSQINDYRELIPEFF
jgi:hypothetical protein